MWVLEKLIGGGRVGCGGEDWGWMGDSERWPQARGLTAEGAHSFRRELAAFHAKGDEWCEWVEARAAELITAIQANPESEKRRQDIVDYVTKLIQSCVNCKVGILSTPSPTRIVGWDSHLADRNALRVLRTNSLQFGAIILSSGSFVCTDKCVLVFSKS